MTTEEMVPTVSKYELDVRVVAALIEQESGGNQYAYNPEPRYRYLWDVRRNGPFRELTLTETASKFPPKDFGSLIGDPDQEFWAQQASWGLMQIMGAVARGHGCRVPYLTELTDEAVNLEYGCMHLAQQLKWAKGNVTQALAAYNGGRAGNGKEPFRNAEYAHKVQQRMRA
jgi:soluble lytic murein transglycosylase-like protein